MKTTQKILFYILIFILSGCVQKEKSKYDELYDIIDNLLRFTYHDTDLVILNLKENKEYFVDLEIPDSMPDSISRYLEPPPPPPSQEYTTYYKYYFTQLYHSNLIDSVDIDYMYNQLHTNERLLLDSTRIDRKCITRRELDTLKSRYKNKDIYEIIHDKFNAYNFIVISVPIISKDKKKILLEIESYCGELCGGGTLYLFEKTNGKWRIKYSMGEWVS